MITEILIAVFSILSFVLLFYSIIVLIKRRQYESTRILLGYNALVFGLFALAVFLLIRGVKYLYLLLSKIEESGLIYFDVLSTLILLPIVAASFLVSMLLFRSV